MIRSIQQSMRVEGHDVSTEVVAAPSIACSVGSGRVETVARQTRQYPWETPGGTIQWPARDLQIAIALANPRSARGARVLNFATLLVERFDELFP